MIAADPLQIRSGYEVRLDVDEQLCESRVTNAGHRFDAAALENTMPDPSSPGGRGVAIMRAVMNEVEFISEPRGGHDRAPREGARF